MSYVTRFAPSPTGLLHLGHAYSALVAFQRARAAGGRFLLRIEDIDTPRCKPVFEDAIYQDLAWLGLEWEQPVMRQSDRRAAYDAGLAQLVAMGLCYPCRCTRRDIQAALSAPQEGAGPDGPVYPGTCRGRPMAEATTTDAIRLDLARALDRLGGVPGFTDTGPEHRGRHQPDRPRMLAAVGDIVIARRDIGTSYHLAVVIDDAAQDITEVVRGVDLYPATPVQRVLQALLALPDPAYHHHRLIRDETGKRLAKRDDARAIRHYRETGHTPAEVRGLVGL